MDTRRARRRRSDGARTHATILDAATHLASVEGIHGLSIGRLAESLGVSKSGLYAHFGSKERLQLETIEHARAIFEREVMSKLYEAPEGLARLEALSDAFFSYLRRWVFPGGCFFASLLAEVDARPGPIRDVVVSNEQATLKELASYVRDGQRLGQVTLDVDPDQVAFEVNASLDLSNYHFVLFKDERVLERGRIALGGIVRRIRT